MSIKIMSNGTGMGTKVINTENGFEIPDIYKAEWSCEAGGFARLTLYCHVAEIEAEANEVMICSPSN